MTKEEKGQLTESLKQKFAENEHFYFIDSSGLSVAQTNKFRRMCFEKGLEYKVVKNTLIEKALESHDTDFTEFNKTVLKGFSGILFSRDTANLPAKVVREFHKTGAEKPLLKGAYINSDFYVGHETLKELSELKSKNELIGEVIALLQSPAIRVISALQSAGNKLAGIIKTISEKEN